MFRGRINCSKPRLPAAYNALATYTRVAHDAAMWVFTVFEGLSAGLRVQESPLYRYPYRSAEEAFRGDAKRIRDDIEASMERGHE